MLCYVKFKYVLDVIDSIGSHIRIDRGRLGLKTNSKAKLHDWSTEPFYVTKELDFEETSNKGNKKFRKILTKSVTYVEDIQSLLD